MDPIRETTIVDSLQRTLGYNPLDLRLQVLEGPVRRSAKRRIPSQATKAQGHGIVHSTTSKSNCTIQSR